MNTVYGPNMRALIETAVARGWVTWRDDGWTLWRRVAIETATLYDGVSGAEQSAEHALEEIRRADLLMLGLA